jgi:hypothetical protein
VVDRIEEGKGQEAIDHVNIVKHVRCIEYVYAYISGVWDSIIRIACKNSAS